MEQLLLYNSHHRFSTLRNNGKQIYTCKIEVGTGFKHLRNGKTYFQLFIIVILIRGNLAVCQITAITQNYRAKWWQAIALPLQEPLHW